MTKYANSAKSSLTKLVFINGDIFILHLISQRLPPLLPLLPPLLLDPLETPPLDLLVLLDLLPCPLELEERVPLLELPLDVPPLDLLPALPADPPLLPALPVELRLLLVDLPKPVPEDVDFFFLAILALASAFALSAPDIEGDAVPDSLAAFLAFAIALALAAPGPMPASIGDWTRGCGLPRVLTLLD